MFHKNLIITVAAFIASVGALPSPKKRALSFDYNNDKVRGVNLGGWFVLEPWITPSIFEPYQNNGVVDEFTLCQHLGSSQCQSILEQHWSTWYTQSDFQNIANAGLNHVRIPIGYWAVASQSGDPYVQGQEQYIDQAIGWARGAGLKVMLDVHGVYGSQNGFDNSGRRGNIGWQSSDSGASKAKAAVDALASRYASQSDVVTSIEAVNEPANWGLDMSLVKQYYYDAWGTIRNHNPDTALVIHDAFLAPDSYWNGFMNSQSNVNNVILDTHQYQIFSDAEVSRSIQDHVNYACGTVRSTITNTDKWTVVGEWTSALTDCAQWLNGLGNGARYDGTFNNGQTQQNTYGSCTGLYQGDVNNLPADYKRQLRMYTEAQLDAYESHTGWIYWTWKAESAPEWALDGLISAGIFPQPLDNRQFPNQCNGQTYAS